MKIVPALSRDDLPPLSPGASYSPWPEETLVLAQPWPANPPKVSIVTPSFNQAEYLEATIRSVLLQGYPNLEYIVIDGGSTDGSLAIIRKYERWISSWVSQPDRGQTDAIQKGFDLCSGEFFNFINSDDLLAPNCLNQIVKYFAQSDIVAGGNVNFSPIHRTTIFPSDLDPVKLINGKGVFQQQSLWMRCDIIRECGGWNLELDYVFDLEMAIRYFAVTQNIVYLTQELSGFRQQPKSKTHLRQKDIEQEQFRYLDFLVKLSHPAIRAAAERKRREMLWHRFTASLEPIRNANLSTALRIALHSLQDPAVRFTRFTAGAIKKALSNPRDR